MHTLPWNNECLDLPESTLAVSNQYSEVLWHVAVIVGVDRDG